MDKNKLVDAMGEWALNNHMCWNSKHAESLADHLLPLITAEVDAQKHRSDVAEEAVRNLVREDAVSFVLLERNTLGFNCSIDTKTKVSKEEAISINTERKALKAIAKAAERLKEKQ